MLGLADVLAAFNFIAKVKFCRNMNKEIVGLNLLLSGLFLSGAFGQATSPSTSPKPVSSALQSAVTTPIVKVRINVRCEEASVRTLVENSLRAELAKSKDVSVLAGPGGASLVIGLKLVPVTGVQTKSPLYAMELTLLDTPALFNALETAGISRQVIYTLLVANELQPIREENILTVVSKDEIPPKMASFMPAIEKHGIERARLAMTLNLQRKPDSQIDTNLVRDEAR
jgi:hypothetical protein